MTKKDEETVEEKDLKVSLIISKNKGIYWRNREK